MILSATQLSMRQALGTGQLTEEVTGRAVDNFEISMTYQHADGSGHLPVTLQKKAGGFFALQFSPERAMPDFSAQTDVILTAIIAVQDRAPIEVPRTVSAADLALTQTVAKVGGTPIEYRRVAGAPFDFSAQVAPLAVALRGVILRDHDPADPIGDVAVTTDPASPGGAVTSDNDGFFFIPSLPATAEITLDLDEGGTKTSVEFTPDYARPVNTLTLSLALPSQ